MTSQTITLTVTIREPLRHRLAGTGKPGREATLKEVEVALLGAVESTLQDFVVRGSVKLEEPE